MPRRVDVPDSARLLRQVAPPRLAIWHVLVWVAGCAVYLALARTFLRQTPATGVEFLRLWLLAGYSSLCWTGAVLALTAGRSVRVEPGHWLLLTIGLILAADLAIGWLPDWSAVPKPALMMAVTCLAVSGPALSPRCPPDWKTLFLVLSLLEAARVALVLAARPPGWVPLAQLPVLRCAVAVLVLAWLIARDQGARQHRSWLHWTGVGCALVWLLGPFLLNHFA